MKEIREQLLQQRQQLCPEDIEQKSWLIHQQLLAFPHFQSATQILFYYPFRQEVDLRLTLQTAWQLRKTVLLPRMQSDKTFTVHKIADIEHDLIQNKLGIKEPAQHCPPFPKENIKLILVPGVVFDLQGNRLGYGQGHYDRFLQKHTAITVGIAYAFQIVPKIIPQNHDIPMNYLITEERIIPCKS